MSSGKWRPFCLGIGVLKLSNGIMEMETKLKCKPKYIAENSWN